MPSPNSKLSRDDDFVGNGSGGAQADWDATGGPSQILNHIIYQTTSANGSGVVAASPGEANWLIISSGVNDIISLTGFVTADVNLENNRIVIAPNIGVTVVVQGTIGANHVLLNGSAVSVSLSGSLREWISIRWDDITGQWLQDGGKGTISGPVTGTPTEVLYFHTTTGVITSDSNFTRNQNNFFDTTIKALSLGLLSTVQIFDTGITLTSQNTIGNVAGSLILSPTGATTAYSDGAGTFSSFSNQGTTASRIGHSNLSSSRTTEVKTEDRIVTIGVTLGGNSTTEIINDTAQTYTFNKLSGGGTEMVTADASGVLGRAPIPSGGGLPPVNIVPYGSTSSLASPQDYEVGFSGGSGATTINLPGTGTVGDLYIVGDAGAICSSNNITVDSGTGNSIIGTTVAQTIIINNDGQVLYFRLIDNTAGIMTWKVQ